MTIQLAAIKNGTASVTGWADAFAKVSREALVAEDASKLKAYRDSHKSPIDVSNERLNESARLFNQRKISEQEFRRDEFDAIKQQEGILGLSPNNPVVTNIASALDVNSLEGARAIQRAQNTTGGEEKTKDERIQAIKDALKERDDKLIKAIKQNGVLFLAAPKF
jgi:hypothetical protein